MQPQCKGDALGNMAIVSMERGHEGKASFCDVRVGRYGVQIYVCNAEGLSDFLLNSNSMRGRGLGNIDPIPSSNNNNHASDRGRTEHQSFTFWI